MKVQTIKVNDKEMTLEEFMGSDGLIVNGYLDLKGSKITRLPNNLHVIGSISLEFCKKITELPRGLIVTDWLFLEGSNVTKLPEGLIVGSMVLTNTKVVELPNNLTVGLLAIHDKTKKLPNNLTINGDFSLACDRHITEIPDNMTIHGYLNIDVFIKRIGNNLIVDGNFNMRRSKAELPKDATVGRVWRG